MTMVEWHWYGGHKGMLHRADCSYPLPPGWATEENRVPRTAAFWIQSERVCIRCRNKDSAQAVQVAVAP